MGDFDQDSEVKKSESNSVARKNNNSNNNGLQREVIINCDCSVTETDAAGMEIECEKCLTWQHVACIIGYEPSSRESTVDIEKYLDNVYYICRRCVKSKNYCSYNEWMIMDFLENGILPKADKKLPLAANGAWWEIRVWLRKEP